MEYSKAIGESLVDFRDIWQALWRGKWLIIAITTCFAVASVFYALSLPNQYRSSVILQPVGSSGNSGLGRLAGNLGGLASLAGINLGGSNSDDKSVLAVELVKTWAFLEAFYRDNQLEVEAFAAIDWDRENNQLILDTEVYDPASKKWLRDPATTLGGTAEPSSWELFEVVAERVFVSKDQDTGLVVLAVEHYSPYVAKKWVDLLVKALNLHFKEQDRIETTNRIAYLQQQIGETNVAEMQTIFYELIQEQTQTLMLAEISEEYVLKTLSPAKVAEEKSKPGRALLVIMITFLGGALSVFIVLVRHFFQRQD